MVLGMILNVFQVASSYPEGSPFSQGRRKSQLARAKNFGAVGYRETSPESLLDTYHAERHAVAAGVLRNTIAELLSMDEPRRRLAAERSGLGIHYDLGERHPLLGRRMPDLDLVTANGPLRVFTLLHDARPVHLNLGEPGGFDITPWADRVELIDAKYIGTWELPAIGVVAAPTVVLIRPDGYVATTTSLMGSYV
jgi:3-(3-hydroxy-phenyl)propionate hydroxylase